ncbi:GGDEF domain-containing protein [Vibrio fluvialis]|nr:GGDEF domain-containing protein [Vibrio fluvialis]
MKPKKNYSKKNAILGPFLVVLVMLAAMIYSYMQVLNNDIDDEYHSVGEMLKRVSKIVIALNYGFSNYLESPPIPASGFNQNISDGLCRIKHKESSVVSNQKANSSPPISISYMMIGVESLCDAQNPLYQSMLRKVSLAPTLSFIHDLDGYITGVHYIDNQGYAISAPDSVIKDLTREQLVTVKLRAFWQQASSNADVISVVGPSAFSEVLRQRNNMALAMPVFRESEFQGVVVMDVSVDKLIGSDSRLQGKIQLVRTADLPADGSAYQPYRLEANYVNLDHYLYYEWNWAAEAKQFLAEKQSALIALLLAYMVSVVALFYFNTRIEKSYYENLASRDPMTGLLNRRGMKEFLTSQKHRRYLSIAVLDIDNFKSINDTHGHDVGDDVICYMGERIEHSMRDTDAVARFGGEEFVVYLTGEDAAQLKTVMQRIKDAITKDSKQVVSNGFTISGGVEVIESDPDWSFDELFKLADEKLYEAKTTGKDKLVF